MESTEKKRVFQPPAWALKSDGTLKSGLTISAPEPEPQVEAPPQVGAQEAPPPRFWDRFGFRKDWSPKIRSVLHSSDGQQVITSVTIHRKPIQKHWDRILQWLSLGKWEERKAELGYDEMYHLSLELGLSHGKTYQFERNHVPELTLVNKNRHEEEGASSFPVNLQGQHIRLRDFLDGIKNNAPEDFWRYRPADCNCQWFVRDVLQQYGWWTNEARDFVMQDASALIKELPWFTQRIMQVSTDAAHLGNVLLHGRGFKRRRVGGDIDWEERARKAFEEMGAADEAENLKLRLGRAEAVNHIADSLQEANPSWYSSKCRGEAERAANYASSGQRPARDYNGLVSNSFDFVSDWRRFVPKSNELWDKLDALNRAKWDAMEAEYAKRFNRKSSFWDTFCSTFVGFIMPTLRLMAAATEIPGLSIALNMFQQATGLPSGPPGALGKLVDTAVTVATSASADSLITTIAVPYATQMLKESGLPIPDYVVDEAVQVAIGKKSVAEGVEAATRTGTKKVLKEGLKDEGVPGFAADAAVNKLVDSIPQQTGPAADKDGKGVRKRRKRSR